MILKDAVSMLTLPWFDGVLSYTNDQSDKWVSL